MIVYLSTTFPDKIVPGKHSRYPIIQMSENVMTIATSSPE